jgi:hypothetical protein
MKSSLLLPFVLLFSHAVAAQSIRLNDLSWNDKKIDYSSFRETYGHLSESAFEAKFNGALERPLMFMRSFVNTYYADAPSTLSPDNLIFCLGDAHPENFGFLEINNTSRYVFNDLDDSGLCPYELDVLRYFTALHMSESDDQLLKSLIREYVQVLTRARESRPLPSRLDRSLERRRLRNLDRHTSGDAFNKESDDFDAMKAEDKEALLLKLAQVYKRKQLTFLDAVSVERETGGSGGLRRFWVLVDDSGEKDILELKEISTPGTEYGEWQPLEFNSPSERLEQTKKNLWSGSPRFYHVFNYQDLSYLLRSRTKDDLNLARLNERDKLRAYRVQVGLMADHHRSELRDAEFKGLEKWLYRNTQTMVERYRNSYDYYKALSGEQAQD